MLRNEPATDFQFSLICFTVRTLLVQEASTTGLAKLTAT